MIINLWNEFTAVEEMKSVLSGKNFTDVRKYYTQPNSRDILLEEEVISISNSLKNIIRNNSC